MGGLETFRDENMRNKFKKGKERILKEMVGKRGGILGSGRNLMQRKLPGTCKDDSDNIITIVDRS